MPRTNSKRSRALEQLQIAADAIAKATTLLGGHPKANVVPKKNKGLWVARRMISSIDLRLAATVDIIAHQGQPNEIAESTIDIATPEIIESSRGVITPIKRGPKPSAPTRTTVLRDDFERDYDKTRNPGC